MTPTEREAKRDPRLDFFRGLGMFIILIAHIPWNGFNNWIPARFGYSDATEIFVFCSGAASAIAFLKVFESRGWWIGTLRVAFRIWQIYWCHIAIFFAVLAALIDRRYVLRREAQLCWRAESITVFGEPGSFHPRDCSR